MDWQRVGTERIIESISKRTRISSQTSSQTPPELIARALCKMMSVPSTRAGAMARGSSFGASGGQMGYRTSGTRASLATHRRALHVSAAAAQLGAGGWF